MPLSSPSTSETHGICDICTFPVHLLLPFAFAYVVEKVGTTLDGSGGKNAPTCSPDRRWLDLIGAMGMAMGQSNAHLTFTGRSSLCGLVARATIELTGIDPFAPSIFGVSNLELHCVFFYLGFFLPCRPLQDRPGKPGHRSNNKTVVIIYNKEVMAPAKEYGMIVSEDKTKVLAVVEKINLSALTLVPFHDAIKRRLQINFLILGSRDHRSGTIALQVLGAGDQFVGLKVAQPPPGSLPLSQPDPRYGLAQLLPPGAKLNQAEKIYIRYDRGGGRVEIDTSTGLALGTDRYSRLSLGDGSSVEGMPQNETAYYGVMPIVPTTDNRSMWIIGICILLGCIVLYVIHVVTGRGR